MSEFFDPERVTVVAILIGLLTGVVRGWWYPALIVDKMISDKDEQIGILRRDRDFYKAIALQMLQNNSKAIDIVQKSIESP